MSFLAMAGATAASGRWVNLPSITYSSYGKFSILNYDKAAAYSLVAASGSATLDSNTGIVTLSAVTTTCQVTATSVKGGSPSGLKTYYRQAHTSDPVYGWGSVGWNYTPGNCYFWPNGDGYCRNAIYDNNALVGYVDHSYAPLGYTDAGAGNDWWKVV